MYRRKADLDPTIVRTLQLDALIDKIKNGLTDEFIAIGLLQGGSEGWDDVTDNLASDFEEFFDSTPLASELDKGNLSAFVPAGNDVFASAWGVFINYVSGKLYSSFLDLSRQADNDEEANVLGDAFMDSLYNLLRGKSIPVTLTLGISVGGVR